MCGFTRLQHTEDDLKHFQPSGRFSVFPFIMGGAYRLQQRAVRGVGGNPHDFILRSRCKVHDIALTECHAKAEIARLRAEVEELRKHPTIQGFHFR